MGWMVRGRMTAEKCLRFEGCYNCRSEDRKPGGRIFYWGNGHDCGIGKGRIVSYYMHGYCF